MSRGIGGPHCCRDVVEDGMRCVLVDIGLRVVEVRGEQGDPASPGSPGSRARTCDAGSPNPCGPVAQAAVEPLLADLDWTDAPGCTIGAEGCA